MTKRVLPLVIMGQPSPVALIGQALVWSSQQGGMHSDVAKKGALMVSHKTERTI